MLWGSGWEHIFQKPVSSLIPNNLNEKAVALCFKRSLGAVIELEIYILRDQFLIFLYGTRLKGSKLTIASLPHSPRSS